MAYNAWRISPTQGRGCFLTRIRALLYIPPTEKWVCIRVACFSVGSNSAKTLTRGYQGGRMQRFKSLHLLSEPTMWFVCLCPQSTKMNTRFFSTLCASLVSAHNNGLGVFHSTICCQFAFLSTFTSIKSCIASASSSWLLIGSEFVPLLIDLDIARRAFDPMRSAWKHLLS